MPKDQKETLFNPVQLFNVLLRFLFLKYDHVFAGVESDQLFKVGFVSTNACVFPPPPPPACEVHFFSFLPFMLQSCLFLSPLRDWESFCLLTAIICTCIFSVTPSHKGNRRVGEDLSLSTSTLVL